MLKQVLLDLYNNIASPTAPTPSCWKNTVIKVIHKSGSSQLPHNYRPIATIPLLYKLFSRLLYNRLHPILDPQQSSDQAGFRPHRSTCDHLFTITQVHEMAEEWTIPLWTATVDFKKAFDTVTHQSIWRALSDQGTPVAYVQLLAKLYDGQTATVRTDRMSREFHIQRGTKQGDPLSSLLFNCVSESIMRTIKQKWSKNRIGLQLQGGHERLPNLRFADYTLS